jgi:hypothetical protein
MRRTAAVLFLAAQCTAAWGQEKPHLIGTWENGHNIPRCMYFPQKVTIKSATSEGAEVTTTSGSGYVRVWSHEETRAIGPAADADSLNFKLASFRYDNGQLIFGQVGPDGLDSCIFHKIG